MIVYCDMQCCNNRKICAVYNTLLKYGEDIQVSLNSCRYLSKGRQSNSLVNMTDPVALAERTKKIKTLQTHQHSLDAPQSARSVRNMGMQFDVDGETLN